MTCPACGSEVYDAAISKTEIRLTCEQGHVAQPDPHTLATLEVVGEFLRQ